MIRVLRLAAVPFVLLAAACSDMATAPQRVPTTLELDEQVITTVVGDSVRPAVTVLDQEGSAMEVPPWSPIQWSVSSANVLGVVDSGVTGRAPGAATATASIAGLTANLTVRVNPERLKLTIAHVAITQEGNPRSDLEPDRAARVDVFLTADEVNFFRPSVRVTVDPADGAPQVFQVQRTEESVPRTYDPADASDAWSVTVPAELIQPGVSIYVEADPAGTIPRASGSIDRYPTTGALALDVRAPALEVDVVGAYLTQSIQSFDGAVPLISGRDALLRVFVTADEQSNYETAVNVTFYDAGAVSHSLIIHRDASIPTEVTEGTLESSWNAAIPGAWLQPGTSLVVEADPEGAFSMKPASEPRYPATGTLALDVRSVPKLWLRMIPIYQAGLGATGAINAANLSAYVEAAESKYPLDAIDADLRSTYMTTALANTEAGWNQILREIAALRTTDGSGRYYYGVLRHPGGVNIGGLGYIGWPAAIGYDQMPYAPETFAHELGHNFDLPHAPCGGPQGPDPNYPYSGGGIGVWGYDLFTGTLKSPAIYKDLMTYCDPAWISDYNYVNVLDYRNQWDWSTTGPDASGDQAPALLVWGGLEGGRLVLEPAFTLPMRPRLPNGSGAYRIQGFDSAGAEIFSYRFDPARVDHAAGAAGNFAFAIPTSQALPDRLTRLRLSGPEGEVERSRPTGGTAPGGAASRLPPVVTAQRVAGGVRLSWQADDSMALVRDPDTGQVISFARGGSVIVPARPLEVLLSDGVRSAVAPVRNP